MHAIRRGNQKNTNSVNIAEIYGEPQLHRTSQYHSKYKDKIVLLILLHKLLHILNISLLKIQIKFRLKLS